MSTMPSLANLADHAPPRCAFPLSMCRPIFLTDLSMFMAYNKISCNTTVIIVTNDGQPTQTINCDPQKYPQVRGKGRFTS